MTKKQYLVYILLVFSLVVPIQGISDQSTTSKDIPIYILEGSEQVSQNAAALNKQKPAMILKQSNIKKVELTRYKEKVFKLTIDLLDNDADELEKITSRNIGKRIAFVKGSQILFSRFILAAVKKPEIVIELSISEQDAKDTASDFDKSFVFVNKQPFTSNLMSTAFKEALKLIDKREYDEAINILKRSLNKTNNNGERVFLYSEMWACYWSKKDYGNAAKAYQLLVQQPITIDLDNYNIITQAYNYLIGFENKHGDIKKAAYYANKSNEVFEYIINNYPLTFAAQVANIGIARAELQNGIIKDAEKRAFLAVQGDMKALGYLLLAGCYEYQDKFENAEKIYQKIIKDFPSESLVAQDYLNSLKHNKSEVKEDIKKYNQGTLYPD